jgi:hypothetical protein
VVFTHRLGQRQASVLAARVVEVRLANYILAAISSVGQEVFTHRLGQRQTSVVVVGMVEVRLVVIYI